MKKIVTGIVLILISFIVNAQHRKLPVESFSKKNKKELFDLYDSYNSKIAIDPTNAGAYFSRGWLRYYLSDTLNAINDLKRAVELDPKSSVYHYAYAYIIIDLKEYENVISECNEALKYDKTFVDVLVLKGSALDQLKKPMEARKNYIKALNIDPTYEDIYLQFASSFAITNDIKEAEGVIARLLKQYPNSEDGLKYKAKMFMHLKKYNEAIAVANELIKSKRSLTEEYLLKAAAYDSLGNREKACECMYNLTLQGYADGYEYIMKNCSKEQEYKQIKINTLQLNAIDLEDRGKFDESMQLFNEIIRMEPDSGSHYYNRGKLKRKMEDHKGAIEDYIIAISKSPSFSASYVATGVSYTFLKDLENAKKYY